MSFSNQMSCIITDSQANIYSFLWEEDNIIFAYFDKVLENVEREVLVEEITLEFDVTIDSNNVIYLTVQKKDGTLLLLSYSKGNWETSVLGEKTGRNFLNLNLYYFKEKLHLFYCMASNEDENILRLYHHIYTGGKWETKVVDDLVKGELLNPFQVIEYKEHLYLGYYSVDKGITQIYLKIYNAVEDQWLTRQQLTQNSTSKLYLDFIITPSELLHLTYSEYQDGNLIIKYERFVKEDHSFDRVLEKQLSNPSNCCYPTLIFNEEKLWVAWNEYDYLASTFSSDEGQTWSNPYSWNETKSKYFIRHKFFTNDKNVKNAYKLNYSFGRPYPDMTLLGFGDLDTSTEIPLKSDDKKKELNHREGEIDMNNKEANHTQGSDYTKVEKERKNSGTTAKEETMRQHIEALYEKIKRLSERFNDLEEEIEVKNNKGIKTKVSNTIEARKEREGTDLTKEEETMRQHIEALYERFKGLSERFNDLEEEMKKLKEKDMVKETHDGEISGDSLKKLEERITDLENYINRRRRGPLFRA